MEIQKQTPTRPIQLVISSILLALLKLHSVESYNYTVDYEIHRLNRTVFPTDFLFGTASSAYQYEGAASEDGRGPTIWDTLTHKFPDKIVDGSNGDVADDSYHRYKEDVRIMKEMGVDAYRFSISWSRLLPYGKLSKGVNQKGLTYYHNLINELLAKGIKPFVTLFHTDTPQFLQDEYGGFHSPNIVDDFRDYVNLCFSAFGNKVKHWITLNEPWSYSLLTNQVAIYSSKQCSKSKPENCTYDFATEPYLLTHHQLLTHAAAVQLYRKKYQASQNGIIGIALNSDWFIPFSKARHQHNAALRALDFRFGWFMDPITFGDYPRTMRSLLGRRLPKFSREQARMLKGSYDFLGLNYYTSKYARYTSSFKNSTPGYYTDFMVNLTAARNGVAIGPRAASDWLYYYPRGIYDLLLYIKQKYKDPMIFITENGWSEVNDPNLSLEEALADGMRIRYYHGHLAFLQRAIREGVKVRGYFAWSLLDNFEWNSGYSLRFGINYVDFKDSLKRYPKHSAKWFQNFLRKQ